VGDALNRLWRGISNRGRLWVWGSYPLNELRPVLWRVLQIVAGEPAEELNQLHGDHADPDAAIHKLAGNLSIDCLPFAECPAHVRQQEIETSFIFVLGERHGVGTLFACLGELAEDGLGAMAG